MAGILRNTVRQQVRGINQAIRNDVASTINRFNRLDIGQAVSNDISSTASRFGRLFRQPEDTPQQDINPDIPMITRRQPGTPQNYFRQQEDFQQDTRGDLSKTLAQTREESQISLDQSMHHRDKGESQISFHPKLLLDQHQ